MRTLLFFMTFFNIFTQIQMLKMSEAGDDSIFAARKRHTNTKDQSSNQSYLNPCV